MRNVLLSAGLLALGACSGKGGPMASAAPPDITSTSFAPELGVDLAAMRQTPRGAYVRDLLEGTGAPVASGTRVAIHYRGTFPSGKQFDANGPSDSAFVFRVDAGEVVAGFDEALLGMKAGGKRLAIIPPSLGYGAQDYGPIPGNSILVFTIELVRVQ